MTTAIFSIAVHALVYLGHKQEMLSSEALAQNVCTNPARIRKVMSMLRASGLVRTKEGAEGGYLLAMQADEITLRAVCEATGTRLVDAAWRSGDVDMDCVVASGMGNIMDEIYAQLDEQCKARLEQITIADIDRKLFGVSERNDRNETV